MKTLLVCAALVFVTFLNGCSGDSSTTPTASSLSCTIDGEAFTGSLNVSGSFSSGVLAIGAVGSNSKQINITIPNAAQQTYTLGPSGGSSGVILVVTKGSTANQIFTANMIVGSGTIVVQELTATRAKGTFSAVATNAPSGSTSTVIDGNFDIKL